ncbi:MAG TPA: hypothetical protein VMW54_11915 [Terriglobia bacterium]|nr:hypothetical protein [Terriglobia bacterium]
MAEQLEQDTETNDSAAELAGYVGQAITEARDLLITERDEQITAANAPLDAERVNLQEEYRAITEAAANLRELLPALARKAQAEHDRLLLAGDREGAAAKLAEQEEAKHAPEGMLARQQEIAEHLAEIEEKKKAIARRVFQQWHGNLQQLIRATEHGLFIELLETSLNEFYRFQGQHNLGATTEKPESRLVKNYLLRI